MGSRKQTTTSPDELDAFEFATRDLVGLALRSIAEADVSLPQLRLLMVLAERGRSTSTACAEALGLAGSSVTRLADRLNASGHLVRGGDPSNRSVVTLDLTAAGHRAVNQVTEARRRELRATLDHLDPDERASCARALATLHRLMSADDGQQPAYRLPM